MFLLRKNFISQMRSTTARNTRSIRAKLAQIETKLYELEQEKFHLQLALELEESRASALATLNGEINEKVIDYDFGSIALVGTSSPREG